MGYHKMRRRGKEFCPDSATIEDAKPFMEKPAASKAACNIERCIRCSAKSDLFKRHDIRKRIFYLIAEQIVVATVCFLIRWKCSQCGKTFTDYPDFALPYKRYTAPTVASYCRQYVEDESASYRSLTKRYPIGREGAEETGAGLRHTTIWRWISTLGRYGETVREALENFAGKIEWTSIPNDLENLAVSPRKYRSECRKRTLIRCRFLCQLENLCKKVLHTASFLDFSLGRPPG